jgi:hypothetical protein
MRGARARLEVGESPAKIFPGADKPELAAAITVLFLKHVELGETVVSLNVLASEAMAYLKARGGKFRYGH